MSTNEFDELIKAKVEQSELAYNPANWDKLTRELHPAPVMHISKPSYMRYAGIAASLLLVVSAFAWLYNRNNTDESVAKAPVAATPPTEKVNHQKSIPATPVIEEESNNIVPANTPISSPVARKTRSTTIVLQSPSNIAENKQPIVTQESKEAIAKDEPTVQENRSIQKPAPANPYALNEPFQPRNASTPTSKTNLSITGGMNYGSLNTGYMAGINARQKIGGKMYVEGDLTLVSNQVTQSTVTANQYDAFNSGGAGKSSESNTVTQTPSNFLYVQFNPSVGYQVHKKISLSVGADLQRLLEQNDNLRTLVYASDEPKLIPGLDVGLTGKTEYAITKKLKAGVLYREGINNLLKGTNEYLDRRYLQVQLKFTVLGK